MSYLDEFRSVHLREGEIAVCWLGQAGFLLRDARGVTVAVDPYLTNCGEALRGFKRLSPMAIQPEELWADYYVVTHTILITLTMKPFLWCMPIRRRRCSWGRRAAGGKWSA